MAGIHFETRVWGRGEMLIFKFSTAKLHIAYVLISRLPSNNSALYTVKIWTVGTACGGSLISKTPTFLYGMFRRCKLAWTCMYLLYIWCKVDVVNSSLSEADEVLFALWTQQDDRVQVHLQAVKLLRHILSVLEKERGETTAVFWDMGLERT